MKHDAAINYPNMQVHDLLKLYNEIGVPPERLLFKIPSTWQVNDLVNNSSMLENVENVLLYDDFFYSL